MKGSDQTPEETVKRVLVVCKRYGWSPTDDTPIDVWIEMRIEQFKRDASHWFEQYKLEHEERQKLEFKGEQRRIEQRS